MKTRLLAVGLALLFAPAAMAHVAAEYKAGEWYIGLDLSDLWAWPDGPRGYLKAIDPLTGKAKWEAPSDIPRFSGVLSTGGGVVFSGQLTGEFEAFDADAGKKLWQFQTGSASKVSRSPGSRTACSTSPWRGLHPILRRHATRIGPGRRIFVGFRSSSRVSSGARAFNNPKKG
jgi:PQQ enzyme repeat